MSTPVYPVAAIREIERFVDVMREHDDNLSRLFPDVEQLILEIDPS